MTIASNNDDDINCLDEPQDAPHELLAPMTEGTQLAVTGLQAAIDSLSLRIAVAKAAGDAGLAQDLQFNIHALYTALAEQSRGFLNWKDREIADKLGEHEDESLKVEYWHGVDEDYAADMVAGNAAFEADEAAEGAASKLARAYERITALEAQLAPRPRTKGEKAKRAKRTKRRKGGK